MSQFEVALGFVYNISGKGYRNYKWEKLLNVQEEKMKVLMKSAVSFALAAVMALSSCAPAFAYQEPQNADTAAVLQEGYSTERNRYAVYPVPQSVIYDNDAAPTEFQVTDDVNVVCDPGIDQYTKDFLSEVLTKYGRTFTVTDEIVEGRTNILLGTNGTEGTARQYFTEHVTLGDVNLFSRIDAYSISAENGAITIIGADAEAAFYGIATLQMMFSSFAGNRFLTARIEDYASMETRGFIEGFYGSWDYAGRESLMRFARDYKMNTYVYASKTDSYHKNAALYPADQLAEIAHLVEIGKQTKVEYAWSVHISYFFNSLSGYTVGTEPYNTNFNVQYTQLLAKFQQLYDAGVRKFDILNDDFGSGSHSEVVRLLNKLDDEFLRPNGCERMSYCPQGYNEAWSGTGAELTALLGLNVTIDIYWTGADVNAPVTQSTVDFLKSRTNHSPVYWLNYPINEHASSGLFMGNISYYARNSVTGLSGLVSNPCRYTEANKTALFQLAALTWNNNGYEEKAESVWEESFKYLQPEVYQEYLTIARNISNCPNSGRIAAGFPESEYIRSRLESVLAKAAMGTPLAADQEAAELLAEFDNILNAITTMRANCKNTALLAEIEPWLKSLKDGVHASQSGLLSVIALQAGDAERGWQQLSIASKALSTAYTYRAAAGETVIAKGGSRRIYPFATKIVAAAKQMITPLLNPDSTAFTNSFYAVLGGAVKTDDLQSAKLFDKDEATYGSYQTVQKAGDYYGVDLGRVITVNTIDILQGRTDSDIDIFHYAALEYSEDGQNWTSIGQQDLQYKISLSDLNIKARYVRMRLTKVGYQKNDYWTFIREFAINKDQGSGKAEIYTNQPDLAYKAVSVTDNTYAISGVTEAILKPGEYLGMKLPSVETLTSINADAAITAGSLAVQYSENGVIWTDAGESVNGSTARYARWINLGAEDAAFTARSFAVTTGRMEIRPVVSETRKSGAMGDTTALSLKEGAWANLFDGDVSTYAWTNANQAEGQYITIDLGSSVPVYDVTVTTADGRPRLYDAEIQVSADNTVWETIATVTDSAGDASYQGAFYTINKNLHGKSERYVRIYITSATEAYLRINEVAINKTVETVGNSFSGNLGGSYESTVDGDVSTVWCPGTESDGSAYFEYRFSDHTNIEKLTILQDASEITNAVVTAEVYDGTKVSQITLGTMDQACAAFNLPLAATDILSLKITWPQGATPSIYEIFTVLRGEDKVREFVERLYEKVLGRTADESEISYYTTSLKAKEKTGADAGYGFVFSPEFTGRELSNADYVEVLYETFMGRASDEGGRSYWTNFLDNGVSRLYVFRGFVESQEYTAICESSEIERGKIVITEPRDQNPFLTMYVDRLYSKALGREAESDGLNYHTGEILAGRITPVQAAQNFICSSEFRNRNLSDKAYVEVLYRTFMGREAEPSGLAYHLKRIAEGTGREEILLGFANSDEFKDIINSFGLASHLHGI